MIPKKPITYENALKRAADLCAKCEQCTPDIARKLNTWGLSSDNSTKVINELIRLRFVDDLRFARAYAHDKLHFSGWGKRKISQGLWTKRLPKSIIEQAFDEVDEDDYRVIATRVIKAKVPSIKEGLESYEGKMKLVRFGTQRGFEVSLVVNIVKQIASEINER